MNIYGEMSTIDMIPKGRNITVTNENKREYVKVYCYSKMAVEIKK